MSVVNRLEELQNTINAITGLARHELSDAYNEGRTYERAKSFVEGYSSGYDCAIDECIEKLYEVTPKTAEQKLDIVFVNELRKMKGKWNAKN